MSKKKNPITSIKKKTETQLASIEKLNALKMAQKGGEALGNTATAIKKSAKAVKEDIDEKLNELDAMLETAITEYNDSYTIMNDNGMRLFIERNRAIDTIAFVESLINSIANHPKSFDIEFDEIRTNRERFLGTCDFGQRELQAAREAAGGAGAGLAAGASVAFMAPTAAMWVATTFGTASTGTAISALSGAAAESAALAWLGGGALTAGGGGMAAGHALLAMAGPIGWSIAGATLLTSILLFTKKRTKLNKQKNEEIENVKRNTATVRKIDAQINKILAETVSVRKGLNDSYTKCLEMFGKDYTTFGILQKKKLGALVNHTRTLSALFGKTIQ